MTATLKQQIMHTRHIERSIMSQLTESERVLRALLDLIAPGGALLRMDSVTASRKALVSRRRSTKSRSSGDAERPSDSAHVRILERATPRTILVRWTDPRTCSYGEQLWRKVRSRFHTQCALTAQPIHPGDMVFQPAAYGGKLPLNYERLILASEAERFLEGEATVVV
jgi:hypothetical protein